jgi:hypothetical protein
MKGYMISHTANRQLTRFKNNAQKGADIDKLLINLHMDGEVVEVPLDSVTEMQAVVLEYRAKGWTLMTLPENEQETIILGAMLASRSMRIAGGNKE